MPHRPLHRYKIFPSLDGLPLGTVLHKLLKDQSWGHVRQLLASRRVQVNGNLCLEEGRHVKKGDWLGIFEHPLPQPPSTDDVTIRYADDHLVIIEKPAGMNTQRHAEERHWAAHRREKMPTLEEVVSRIMAARAPHQHHGLPKKHKSAPHPARTRPSQRLRVRAVHRLDRDTSGVMVFALTDQAERGLISLFRGHDIERIYHAVAIGRVNPMRIQSNLVRDRGDGLRGSVASATSDTQARRAITHVRPLQHLGDDYTLLECRLETGRTHQIRIHLAERGHMICGEKIYCRQRDGSTTPDNSQAPRQALHAAVLGFRHPITGKPMRFESPWPRDMHQWLTALRRQYPAVNPA